MFVIQMVQIILDMGVLIYMCSFSCVEQPMWMLKTSGSTLWSKAVVPDGRRQCNGSGQQFKGSPRKTCQSSYSLSQGPPDCLPKGLRTWHTQFAFDLLMANMDGFHLQPRGNVVRERGGEINLVREERLVMCEVKIER